MKDKLIIIATIQNVLMHMTQLLADNSPDLEKRGTLKGVSVILLDVYFVITGNFWKGSPKELMDWMIQYCKDEADKLDGGRSILRIQ